MSFVPEKNDFLVEENGVAAADDMGSVVKNDSDNSFSSSVGLLSGEEEGGEAQSQSKTLLEGSLNSLASLEAALPFKRGLSGFYNGKSKSFMNLAEVKCVKEVEKEESSLNKRRRLTMAQKWGTSSSSMPLLTHSDGKNTHSVGFEQESKSSTTSTSISSVNSTTKPYIN